MCISLCFLRSSVGRSRDAGTWQEGALLPDTSTTGIEWCHKDTQHLSGHGKNISIPSSHSSNSQLLPAKQPAFIPPAKTAKIWVIGLDPAKQKDHRTSRNFFKCK